MWTEQFVESDPVRLNLAIGPASGPPLLLLHGVTRRWQDFLTLTPALRERWQLHALDFRGHGRSARCPGAYRVLDYADDVICLLQTQFKEPVALYGHSLGALVAAAVAAELPRQVRAVVLEDPPGVRLLRNIRETPFFTLFTCLRELAGPGHAMADVVRQLAELRLPSADGRSVRLGDLRDPVSLRFSARCLQDLDPEALTVLLEGRWLEGYDVERVLRGVRCPALLLRADEACGGMLQPPDGADFAAWLSDGCAADFPRTGHLIHWLEPAKTAQLAVGFLESLR